MKLGGSIGYLLIFPIIPNLWNSDKNWARYGSFNGKGWLRILGTSVFFFITKKVVQPRLRHLKINSKLKQCRPQCCVLSSFRIIRNYWLWDRNSLGVKPIFWLCEVFFRAWDSFMVWMFGESCSAKLCINVIFEGDNRWKASLLFLFVEIILKAIYGDNRV